ncbi:eukaryotic translation initiation factor eIF-4E [Trypanosoma rangeli SC58]|uniref:Eukaryotic translation initiation factor eIF-4E n=1 Tax=Trypanosoma rangeli SC58 TaxID=429131 RepID=A0A061J398_TRYRA|nr:eukaryotic translation initiation factor eIF-4E [Trypanosoma rangeli SC58]
MSDEKLRGARADPAAAAANSATVADGAETKLAVPRSLDPALKKHPLHSPWTLWYDSISTYDSERWELSLVEVMTVHTVEEFFVMLHYCKPPHVLRLSAQYHFFREGVKPMWEDPRNKDGGKLWFGLDDKKVGDVGKKWENVTTGATAGGEKDGTNAGNNNSSSNHGAKAKKDEHEAEKKPEFDTMWENLLMALVGEYLDPEPEGEHIMGLVLSKRKYQNRIALWLRDASASEAVARIEKKLVKEAGLPPSVKIIFTPHSTGKS